MNIQFVIQYKVFSTKKSYTHNQKQTHQVYMYIFVNNYISYIYMSILYVCVCNNSEEKAFGGKYEKG